MRTKLQDTLELYKEEVIGVYSNLTERPKGMNEVPYLGRNYFKLNKAFCVNNLDGSHRNLCHWAGIMKFIRDEKLKILRPSNVLGFHSTNIASEGLPEFPALNSKVESYVRSLDSNDYWDRKLGGVDSIMIIYRHINHKYLLPKTLLYVISFLDSDSRHYGLIIEPETFNYDLWSNPNRRDIFNKEPLFTYIYRSLIYSRTLVKLNNQSLPSPKKLLTIYHTIHRPSRLVPVQSSLNAKHYESYITS